MQIDPELRSFATPRQLEYIDAIEKHGSQQKAAKALGIGRRTLDQGMVLLRKNAALRGYSPAHDMVRTVPDGFKVKGVSTYYNAAGKPSGQWVKSTADEQRQREMMQAALEAMSEDMPKLPAAAAPGTTLDSLLAVYPLGDPHIGMLSWGEETGADFDLRIAERDLCAAMAYLVQQAPAAKRAVIINLGDYFHADNMVGMTSRSGNVMDMDSRLPKMFRVGVKIMRQLIDSALKKHETVEVVNAIGNHDDVLAMVMSVMLANIYENEPRIIIHDQPTSRHYIQHGKVLIGVTHGHQTKDAELPGIMATERPRLWGDTQYRYFYRGHHHHDSLKEYNGCIVEQFRTLAAGDAYAVSGGFLSGRDMKCIVHHADYGEVARNTCALEMLA
jgi:hypothetical protein